MSTVIRSTKKQLPAGTRLDVEVGEHGFRYYLTEHGTVRHEVDIERFIEAGYYERIEVPEFTNNQFDVLAKLLSEDQSLTESETEALRAALDYIEYEKKRA